MIQRITGNVARNVRINFSGDIRVKSSVGLHPDKVGLAQHNTLASWIDRLPTHIQTNDKDNSNRNMAWIYIGVDSSRCNYSSICFE